MATIGQQLSQPEAGWRRYDDSIGLIKYDGTWQSNMPNSSSWMGTRHISSNLPDKVVKFVFKGTKLRLLVNSASNRSNNSTITIDGESHTFSSKFTTTLTIAPTRLAFEKIDLPDDYHTVIISDTTTDYIDIDAIDIDEDGELVRYDYLENPNDSDLMSKYGVAWFGFDEESGNVLDKLGGDYIGVVTGATRVEGWNGQGNSILSNNINQRVLFNNAVLPSDDFTIRFKLKYLRNTQAVYIINTSGNFTSTARGFSLYTSGADDKLYTSYYNGTSHLNQFSTKHPVATGEWMDVIISKTDERTSIYINEELSGSLKNSVSTYRHTSNLSLLNMTAFLSTTGRFLKGQIDDFQVYSKALVPSDFAQRYVSVKTLDNKTLTLPNKQGRVKELLSTEESDLINESYNWLDIDNAIDRSGIKITHSTTEYEIVGKDNSSLGNGKVFILPIENFKTVKVENNY